MTNHKLLIVEDDPNLGLILKEYFAIKGYTADLFDDGKKGLEGFTKGGYDLCILDVMLPKKDGFTLASEIRQINKSIPIIFLTAKSLKEDTIKGFKTGGDDYVTKPFSMEELLLRIQAILRRQGNNSTLQNEQEQYEFGSFTFDFTHQKLTSPEGEKKLTTKEAELLRLLCSNINQTLDRSIALKRIWQDDNYFNARSMDVYITKLRKYLKPDEKVQIITVHGQGFKLVIM